MFARVPDDILMCVWQRAWRTASDARAVARSAMRGGVPSGTGGTGKSVLVSGAER